MQGYAEYLQQNYTDAIGTLDRFIQLHPANRDIAYAYYLRALCYYEQIADIARDQKGTQEAMGALQEVVNRFPDSAYAPRRAAEDRPLPRPPGRQGDGDRPLLREQHLYAAAIGRFQRVVDDYQTTNHVPEALHAADRDLPEARPDGPGAADGRGARLTTIPAAPGTRTATTSSSPTARCQGAAGQLASDGAAQRRASSAAPGTAIF